MKVIITGGTGLLGQALSESLVQDGYEVIVLSRNPEHAHLLPGMRAVRWDGRSADGWANEVNGADIIVNFAGENLSSGLWTAARKKRFLTSRLNSGLSVSDAIERAAIKPGLVVQASAVGYYGPHGDDEVTEETSPGKDFLANLCRTWESSTADVEKLGVRRVILRTGLPLTLKGRALRLMALPYKLFAGGPVGSGKQYVPWIHIKDEIRAIRFLIDRPDASGPYNLSAPNPVTNREFGQALAKALHRPFWLPVPSFALKLALGELSEVALEGQREVPARLEQAGFQFEYPDVQGALNNLYPQGEKAGSIP